jgi:Dyp-type peroxidase family
VFRRLRQNVQAFGDFVSQHAQQLGIPPERLGAKLVGRWRSGAPLEHVPGEPAHLDPSLEDPSAAHPNVLDDSHINHFDYADDQDGQRVPRAAHIRKMNPRAEEPPGRGEANRHRILRRGIPYGPEFEPGEPPYPGGPAVPDNQDRGLLFLCYQGSITRGFEFVQAQWANRSDFPQGDDGRDPIISQDIASPDFFLASSNAHLTMARWVQTTGGEYFFAPSIEAIQTLAAGGA